MEVTVQKVESAAIICLVVVLIAIGVRVFFVTIPQIEIEVQATQNLSVIAAQNGANLRQITEREKVDLPVTQGKVNVVLDDTHTTLQSTNTLIKHLDKNQDTISKETVATLKALAKDLDTAAQSIKDVGDQTVDTEDAIAKTADAATGTAGALTTTSEAATGTAVALTNTVNQTKPAIVATAQNVQTGTGYAVVMLGEAKTWVHGFFHPTWAERLKSVAEEIGIDAGKVLISVF